LIIFKTDITSVDSSVLKPRFRRIRVAEEISPGSRVYKKLCKQKNARPSAGFNLLFFLSSAAQMCGKGNEEISFDERKNILTLLSEKMGSTPKWDSFDLV